MQQISSLAISGTTETSFIPFDFGNSAVLSDEFQTSLQNSLAKNQISEQDILIKSSDLTDKKNLTDFLDKLAKTVNGTYIPDPEDSEEIPPEIFTLLGFIDKYVDNLEEITSIQEIHEELNDSDMSKENVEEIIDILNKIMQISKDQPTTVSTAENDTPKDQTQPTLIIANNAISSFTANNTADPKLMAEKIITGESLVSNSKKQTANIALNNETNNNAELDNTTPADDSYNESTAQNLNTSKEQPKGLTQLLSMFEKTKEVAAPEYKNAIKEQTNLQTEINKTEPQEAKIAPTNNNSVNNNIIANMQSSNVKNNIGNNKSEYKELSNSIDGIKETEVTEADDQPVKNTKTVETQAQINNAVSSLNARSLQQPATTTTNEANIAEISQNSGNIDSNTETTEAKQTTSNLNMHLYKIAQQANIHNQINVAIKNLKNQNGQQVKIKLNPEELGNISIEMEISDSAAKGVITVERPEVAQQLAQNLKGIFTNFKDSGLDVKDIVVKIGENPKNEQQPQNQKRGQEQSSELEFSFSENDLIDISV